MNSLEVLVKAYVELTVVWARTPVGDNAMRIWKSCDFLAKLIKKELEKN